MDDSRWDAPRPELLGDADVVAFGDDRPPRRPAPRWLVPALAISVGLAIGAGATYVAVGASSSAPRPTRVAAHPQHHLIVPAEVRVGPFQPSPAPADPKMTTQSWCASALPPAGSSRGGRFVSAAVLSNMGNVGMTYLVTGQWALHDVRLERSTQRAVSPGTVEHVRVVLPVTRQEVVANRALAAGTRCSVRIQLTGTFRDPSS